MIQPFLTPPFPCFEFLGRAIELQIRQITWNVPKPSEIIPCQIARDLFKFRHPLLPLFLGIFVGTTRGFRRIEVADVSNR